MDRITVMEFDDSVIGLRVSPVQRKTWRPAYRSIRFTVNDYNMTYVIRGCLDHEVGGHRISMNAGDIVFENPGDAVRVSSHSTAEAYHCHFRMPVQLVRVGTFTRDEWFKEIGLNQGRVIAFEHTFLVPDHLHIGRMDEVSAILSATIRDQERRDPGHHLTRAARFILLLRLVSLEAMRLTFDSRAPSATTPAALHVGRAIHFIETNLNRPMALHDVAKALRMNQDYLARLFHSARGTTVGAYVRKRKLAIARELLSSSEMTVKEVASAAGFRDALYFSRLFRAELGMSPREYRTNCASGVADSVLLQRLHRAHSVENARGVR